jgi:predicted N-acetyltransferase YhbS
MTAVRTPIALAPKAAPFAIRAEKVSDLAAREALLDVCFGEDRHARTCQRLRDGRAPAEGLAFSAVARGAVVPNSKFATFAAGWERTSNSIGTTANFDSARGESFGNSPDEPRYEAVGNFRTATRLVGTVRLWHVSAGGIPALVLGPLAVGSAFRKLGVGAALITRALAAARARGHRAVLLLGDAAYYARFGFSAAKTAELKLPGAFEQERLLGIELVPGALDGAWGMIVPTGGSLPKPKAARTRRSLRPAAAVA